jgi:hypothetical protein
VLISSLHGAARRCAGTLSVTSVPVVALETLLAAINVAMAGDRQNPDELALVLTELEYVLSPEQRTALSQAATDQAVSDFTTQATNYLAMFGTDVDNFSVCNMFISLSTPGDGVTGVTATVTGSIGPKAS